MEQKIVMVVDKMSDHKLSADIFRNDLEGNSVNQTMRLKNSLEKIGDVVCYVSVKATSENRLPAGSKRACRSVNPLHL